MIRAGSKRAQRGDTIVEVLIVIAIISLVLGGAFASARRSFITTIQTQERGEAIKYLEQQLERVKAASDADDADGQLFGSPASGNFCVTGAIAIRASTSPECVSGPGGRYRTVISRQTNTINGRLHHTFHAQIIWDRIGGGQPEEIHMYYRVHPKQ